MPFIYQILAEEIQQQIHQGVFKSGEKMPSLRALSQQRQLSIATVTRAYEELERQQLIHVLPQSGYYVLPPGPDKSPQLQQELQAPVHLDRDRFIQAVLQRNQVPGIIPLGATVLSPQLLPTQRLNRLLRQLSTHPDVHRYAPMAGHPELLRQIARRSLQQARPVSAQEIVVCCGCMEAIHIALRCVAQAGDVVAVESPGFYGILQSIESLGMRALELPTDPQHGLDPEHFSQALKQHPIKAFISVSNFQNPLGCLISTENKTQILALAKAHDCIIIEDNIYGELYFGKPPDSFYDLDDGSTVIFCSSFSKTLTPGFRVGWALPGHFYERFVQFKRIANLCTASLTQLVLAEYLSDGSYERYLRQLRRKLQLSQQHTLGLLAENFPKSLRYTQPQGGFVLWLQMPEGFDAMKLHQQALQAGISIAPGPLFSAQDRFHNAFRLSLNLPWGPELEKALLSLGKLMTRMQ